MKLYFYLDEETNPCSKDEYFYMCILKKKDKITSFVVRTKRVEEGMIIYSHVNSESPLWINLLNKCIRIHFNILKHTPNESNFSSRRFFLPY